MHNDFDMDIIFIQHSELNQFTDFLKNLTDQQNKNWLMHTANCN